MLSVLNPQFQSQNCHPSSLAHWQKRTFLGSTRCVPRNAKIKAQTLKHTSEPASRRTNKIENAQKLLVEKLNPAQLHYDRTARNGLPECTLEFKAKAKPHGKYVSGTETTVQYALVNLVE